MSIKRIHPVQWKNNFEQYSIFMYKFIICLKKSFKASIAIAYTVSWDLTRGGGGGGTWVYCRMHA